MMYYCAICLQSFDSTSHLSATTCGHVFHRGCLMEWFSRTQTCPVCRRRNSVSSTCQLFFNIWNETDNGSDDRNAFPRNQDENLMTTLKEKDSEVKNALETIQFLINEEVTLREQVKKCQELLSEKEVVITSLRDHVRQLSGQFSGGCLLREETGGLQIRLDDLQKKLAEATKWKMEMSAKVKAVWHTLFKLRREVTRVLLDDRVSFFQLEMKLCMLASELDALWLDVASPDSWSCSVRPRRPGPAGEENLLAVNTASQVRRSIAPHGSAGPSRRESFPLASPRARPTVRPLSDVFDLD
ncbi:E3 ubiquitin-protein ligase TRAIP-like isoform X2 [Bacillus rossius redtenbacheri]|uniref:E3 ubiquitin-protein ligase TRAIP-like isoform X2 n=1 Tax=Bacillus rossius redtenbacheri TaxID=93214 RepID=UPI002FDE40E1